MFFSKDQLESMIKAEGRFHAVIKCNENIYYDNWTENRDEVFMQFCGCMHFLKDYVA